MSNQTDKSKWTQSAYGKSFSQASEPNKENLDRHQQQKNVNLNKNQWTTSCNSII